MLYSEVDFGVGGCAMFRRQRSTELSSPVLERERASAANTAQSVNKISTVSTVSTAAPPLSMLQRTVLAAQQQYGNAAVRRMIASSPVQQNVSGGHSTLRVGSNGPEVVDLQNRLNAAGAQPQLQPDGAFGGRTRTAVVTFQQSKGLGADGVVGPMTWAALDAGGSTTPATMPGGSTTPGGTVTPGGTTTPGTTATPGTTLVGGDTPGGEGVEPVVGEVPPAAGQRAQVVSNALGEVGKVHARRAGEADPDTGKTTRYGWSDLDKYFEASYGGKGGAYNSILQSDVKFYNTSNVKWKRFGGQRQSHGQASA